MPQAIMNELKTKLTNAETNLKGDLTKLRTGRASLAIIDGIKVDYYGNMSELKAVANLSLPDAKTVAIQPWDAKMISVIEKAIQAANIGINPVNNGKVIRLQMPDMTEDRRKELVKVVKKMGEDSKISIRQSRKEALDKLKNKEKVEKSISEDDSKKYQDQVQKDIDNSIKNIDTIVSAKEKEIMSL